MDDALSTNEPQRRLWSHVEMLWKLAQTRNPDAIRATLHPQYTGWVTGRAQPHDREAAVASASPSSPRVLSYRLQPLSIRIFDDVTAVVNYSYAAEVETTGNAIKHVLGRWTEVYLHKNGNWLMIAVSGGPDGER